MRVRFAAVTVPGDIHGLAALLTGAGFVAGEDEAGELVACAAGDDRLLATLVGRRLTGEPLAWITGRSIFCGLEIRVEPGVFVPRPHSEDLARRAAERLPPTGIAIDLCTGSGAIAAVLHATCPAARVIASDIDGCAVACAAANGIEVVWGDLFDPIPAALAGHVDVVVAVAPYVPTSQLRLLQRDTFAFESRLSYDGGPDGADVLRRIAADARRFLRPGGTLLVELGGRQDALLREELSRLGYGDVGVIVDAEDDVRGIEATRGPAP